MKEDWHIENLEDICEFGNGLWKGKKPPYRKVGVIRNTNFTKDCKLDDSDIIYLDVEINQFTKRKLKYGDLILEKSGGGPKQPVGRVIVFDKKDGDFSFSNFTSIIRIVDPYKVDFTYLHRFLLFSYISGITETMQSHSTGIRNLKFDEYKAIKIPLPPLPEQKLIVARLDNAFDAIEKAKDNAEQNLKNAKELFESYLQNVFENKGNGWEYLKLGDICKINDGTHFSPKNSSEGKYMYITAKNIKPFHIDLSKITYISEKDHKEIYARCSVSKGDVLYIKDGATAGIATINTLEEEFSLLSSVALFKCSSKILNSFLVYYMNSTIGRKNFLGYIDGAAITRLTLIKLKNVLMCLPSINDQQKIVLKLDSLSKETKRLEEIYKTKIANLEELKKSILQKAFSGQL
ncbi:MAG: restriction endonuclease subunit S [Ignavibacteria bacterium]|nr:restriction endonuclease subunit S [Ignavibacteria bacterium]